MLQITHNISAALKFESRVRMPSLSLFLSFSSLLFSFNFYTCLRLFCPLFLHCFCTSFFQIPVYLGASRPLLATPPVRDFYGKDGLGDFVYPDAPTPADYLKREHAAVALVRLASQYPSRFLVIVTEAKEGELTDRPFLHLHRALILRLRCTSLRSPLSFSHSVHMHSGNGNHVIIFASDKRFGLNNIGQKRL